MPHIDLDIRADHRRSAAVTRYPRGDYEISGIGFRGCTDQPRLFVGNEGQKDERRTHICKWIASLIMRNSGCRPWAVLSLGDEAEAMPQYKTPHRGEKQIPQDCSDCTNVTGN